MSLSDEDREALANGLRDGWIRRVLDLPEDQWPCSDEEEVELVVPVIEQIVASHVEASKRAHRHEWADYLENWVAAVGPEPPTVESIIAALRAPSPPFGVAANSPPP